MYLFVITIMNDVREKVVYLFVTFDLIYVSVCYNNNNNNYNNNNNNLSQYIIESKNVLLFLLLKR